MLLSLKKYTLATAFFALIAIALLYIIPYIYFIRAIDSFSSWLPGIIVTTNTDAKVKGVIVTGSGNGIHITHQWLHGPKEFFLNNNWVKDLAKMRTTGTVNNINIIATTYLHWDLSTTTVWETKERNTRAISGPSFQRVSGVIKEQENGIVFSWNIDKPCWDHNKILLCANEIIGDSIFSHNQWEHHINITSAIASNSGSKIANIYGINIVAYMQIGKEIQGNFDFYFDKLSTGSDDLYHGVLLTSVEGIKAYVIDELINSKKIKLNNGANIDIHEASFEIDGTRVALNASISDPGLRLEGSIPRSIIGELIKQDIKLAMATDLKKYDLSFEGVKIPTPKLRSRKESVLELRKRISSTISSMLEQDYLMESGDNYFISLEYNKGHLKFYKVI